MTLSQAIFTLSKSAIGAGTLFMPYNIMRMGLFPGVSMLIVAAVLCATTLHFLARLSANTDMSDYFSLGKLAYGTIGEATAVASLLLYLLAALIMYSAKSATYMISSISSLLEVDATAWYLQSSTVILVISLLLIFPLSCLKDLSKLAKASLVGLACIFYVVLLTAGDYFYSLVRPTIPTAPVTITLMRFENDFFSTFSNMLFAFANHFTIVAIIPSMMNANPARRNRLIVTSTLISSVLYLITGIFGYLHFGDKVARDILQAPAIPSIAYHIGRMAVGLTLILSYPLLCDPTRSCLDYLVTMAIGKSSGSSANLRHYLTTFTIVIIPAFFAIFFLEQVGDLLNVFASLCGSLLSFVFPALYFLRMSYKYPVHIGEKIMAWVCIIFGMVVCVLGTGGAIQALFK